MTAAAVCAPGDAAQAQANTQAQPAPAAPALRPPAVPLVAVDPYFSIWSPADRLTDAATVHWTGRPDTLDSLVRVDGEPFRIMGATPADTAAMPQTSLAVHPTRTVYTFADKRVRITLTFLTPVLPWDLDLLSRPVTYLSWDIVSADGKPHQVQLYADCGAELAVNTPEQSVGLDYPVVDGLAVARMEGNADFAGRYWPVLTRWAEYLKAKGFDPENQLCTDDFAGHLAHNVNLSAKAIVALGAFAQLAAARGERAVAQEYRALAEQFAARWVKEAAEGTRLRRADFEALVHPIFTFLDTTPHRVPMTDWYWTHDASKVGFQARSVVGGVFLRLLYEPAVWKTWAAREKTKAAGWAGLPLEK